MASQLSENSMKVKTGWVPSAFTMANMFCGYYSVVLSAQDKFVQAAWLIVAAAVLDTLDGKIARLANVSSHFGVEYDSLADVVSFGFAPSFLAYKAVFDGWGTMGLFISIGPLVFGSVRLARFNVRLKGFNKSSFEGLPTPAAAIVIATFLVFNYHFWGHLRWEKVFLFLVIAVSVLMVSTFRYETMPNFSLQKGAPNRRKVIIVIIGVITVILFPQEAFFPWAVAYAASGPVLMTWMILFGSGSEKGLNEEKTDEGTDKHPPKKRHSRSPGKSS